MLAFNNDKVLKDNLIKEIKWHRELDMIIAGRYGSFSDASFKGCAVGCSLHSYGLLKGIKLDTSNHKAYELFGIPKLLARLEDGIFEGLPSKEQQLWPEQFMEAINVGADLSTVWPQFAIWLLVDKKYGAIQYAKTDNQRLAIQQVADLYKTGGTKKQFKEAGYFASSAAAATDAAYADYAARVAAATNATAAAAYAAAAAATDAAYAAHAAAAYAAHAYAAAPDRKKYRIAQSKKLISLLKACKS